MPYSTQISMYKHPDLTFSTTYLLRETKKMCSEEQLKKSKVYVDYNNGKIKKDKNNRRNILQDNRN